MDLVSCILTGSSTLGPFLLRKNLARGLAIRLFPMPVVAKAYALSSTIDCIDDIDTIIEQAIVMGFWGFGD